MEKVKNTLKTIFSKKNLIVLLCFLSSLSLMFCSGIFSPDTKNEEISSYMAETVRSKVPSKDLLCITVESNSGLNLPDSESQFLNLYGVFRQERITFASGYNFHKSQTITIGEIDSSANLSAVYIGSTTGSEPYKGHFKDITYPVEFMFPLKRNDAVSVRTACLSTSQARTVLKNRGIIKADEDYVNADYEKLLNTATNITIDGEVFDFLIQDIFYEDTYYINGLNNTIGDFFITSYYFPKKVQKANAYFMSGFEYENKFFIDYINEVYGSVGYDIKPVTTKLTGTIDAEYIVSFSKTENSLRFLEAIFITIGTFAALLGIILVFHFFEPYSKTLLISHLAFLFVPYICFYLAHVIFKTIVIFANTGTVANAITCIVGAVLLIGLYFYKKYYKIRVHIKKAQKEKYEELGI